MSGDHSKVNMSGDTESLMQILTNFVALVKLATIPPEIHGPKHCESPVE